MDNTRLVRLRALMTLIFNKATAWGLESPSFLRYEQVESAYLAERDTLPPRYWDRDARLNRVIDALDTAWYQKTQRQVISAEEDSLYLHRYAAIEDAMFLEKVVSE